MYHSFNPFSEHCVIQLGILSALSYFEICTESVQGELVRMYSTHTEPTARTISHVSFVIQRALFRVGNINLELGSFLLV